MYSVLYNLSSNCSCGVAMWFIDLSHVCVCSDANLRMMSNLRITENIPVGYSMRRDGEWRDMRWVGDASHSMYAVCSMYTVQYAYMYISCFALFCLVHTCTLMEVFISTYGRGLVMKRLLEASPFKPNAPVYAYWRDLLPWILDQLIKYWYYLLYIIHKMFMS